MRCFPPRSTPTSVTCDLVRPMSSGVNVHKKVHNRQACLVVAFAVVGLVAFSLYLGYLIGNTFSPNRYILPDRGVVVPDQSVLNMSAYNTHYLAIQFSGGLGSQMFQYAALYGAAKANGLKAVIANDPDYSLLLNVFPYLRASRSKHPHPGARFLKFREHKTHAFDQRAFQLNFMKDIELLGEFKSWRYFDHVRSDVRSQFSFAGKALNMVQGFLREAKNKYSSLYGKSSTSTPQFVSLHIRRGDMLEKKNSAYGYLTADKHYLLASMQYFKHKFSNNVIFVVVSDDLRWCQENLKSHENLIVFSPFYQEGLDMCLLSQCNHSVLTLGSFGWWGAWLAGGDTLYYRDSPKMGSELQEQFSRTDHYLTQWFAI